MQVTVSVDNDDIVGQFIRARILTTGCTEQEALQDALSNGVQALVRERYKECLDGKVTFGYMAKHLGIHMAALKHILDVMGMPIGTGPLSQPRP